MSKQKTVDEKLDKILEEISEIKFTQVEQAADLKHHIYRTELNEERLEIIENEFKPVKEKYQQLSGAFKFVGMVATGAGLVLGAIKVCLAFLA